MALLRVGGVLSGLLITTGSFANSGHALCLSAIANDVGASLTDPLRPIALLAVSCAVTISQNSTVTFLYRPTFAIFNSSVLNPVLAAAMFFFFSSF